jgi:hypothetical protein
MKVRSLQKFTKKNYRVLYNTTKIIEIINFIMNKKLTLIVKFGLNRKDSQNSMII